MQGATADFGSVPVVEVGTDNIQQFWPSILLAIKSASFVALDLELSGLGDRRQINAKSIEDRYKAMCDVAKTRSIVSVGLSCFKLHTTHTDPPGDDPTSTASTPGDVQKDKALNFSIQTFNILVLCSENYVVEPLSLKFLIDHGFDFNMQYANGLPYFRGSDKVNEKPSQCIRQLFSELVTSGVPVVLHNALIDLVFLYQNLYANIPAQLPSFLADLSQVFSEGIYDTKYITEFKARMPASYLSYVFRKCQRENSERDQQGQACVRAAFLSYPATLSSIIYMPCSLDMGTQATESTPAPKACAHYAAHGWCAQASACPNSHNIDIILASESTGLSAKKRRRKHRHRNGNVEELSESDSMEDKAEMQEEETSETDSMDTLTDNMAKVPNLTNPDQNPAKDDSKPVTKMGGHRAGFDAFMTGFTLAVYLSKYGKPGPVTGTEKLGEMGIGEFSSKVSLSGKDIPLHIIKSNFAKTSREHREKIARLNEEG